MGTINNINTIHFKKNLREGEDFEKVLINHIKKKYPRAYKKKGNFKWFDLYIPEIEEKIEVKWDARSVDTNNYFIEYMFNGEPSGISTTQAKWWAIGNEYLIVWVKTDELKRALKSGKYRPSTHEGQDGTLIKSFIVPCLDIKQLDSSYIIRTKESYQKIWEEMGSPLDFTVDDMKWIDKNL